MVVRKGETFILETESELLLVITKKKEWVEKRK